MSVMFSHIDFNPQDDDEEELDIEDAHQQEELKAFLDNELDDDYLLEDASFTSHVFTNQNENEQTSHSPHNRLKKDFQKESKKSENGFNFGLSEEYLQLQKGAYPFQQQNPYMAEMNNNAETFVNVNSNNAEYLPKNGRGQLEILYQARGRKIEELQKNLNEKEEEKQKEIRVLQHKLTMSSTEMEGLRISISQLNAVIQDQKHETKSLRDQIQSEHEQCRLLTNQLEEANEKLFVSDSTIDALQIQIRELNQTESLSRTRAHHESMLATLREKHEEEILSLKEKVDTLQQNLAWKTEDLNRYKELLDSNSSSSEIGILRNRLSNEEKKVKSLENDLEMLSKHNSDLEEHLKMFEVALKLDPASNYLSSTPLNAATAIMGRDKLGLKTPISRDKLLDESQKRFNAKANDDSTIRNELIKALNSNREKRQEIKVLYDEIAALKLKSETKSNTSKEHEFASKAINRSLEILTNPKSCVACKSLQNDLECKSKELHTAAVEFNMKLESLEKENLELKKNMVEMVKNFDKDKLSCLEKQSNALMHLVDDAKENLRKELTDMHQQKISMLSNEIDRLNGELLFTQEEYNRLCDDMKSTEHHLTEELSREKALALIELETKLNMEHQEHILHLQDKLNNQHIEDVEAFKIKWQEKYKKEQDILIQNAVSLAKVDFLNKYKSQQETEIKKAVDAARDEWLMNHHSETGSLIKQLKDEWSSEQQSAFDCKLNSAKVAWEQAKRSEIITMLSDIKVQQEIEVKELQQNLENANQEILCLKSQLLSATKSLETYNTDPQNTAFKSDVDKSQSSVLLEEILQSNVENDVSQIALQVWKNKELLWKQREEELTLLVKELQEQQSVVSRNYFTQEILKKGYQESLEEKEVHQHVLPALEEKLGTIIKSKEKVWHIKEMNYKKELGSISEEYSKLKDTVMDRDHQICSLRKELLDLKESSDGKIYQYQKQTADLKNMIKKLEEQLMLEKEIAKEEIESLKAETEGKIQSAVLLEKKKYQEGCDKLREDQIKAEGMFLKERLLNEVQHQSEKDNLHKIATVKAEYDIIIKDLKQGFRQKLEKISEMKRKWLAEEEQKRSLLVQNLKEEYSMNEKILQRRHEELFVQQRQKYENSIAQLDESLGKANEEKNKEIEIYLGEKTRLEEVVANMASVHKQEMQALEAEWQSRLDKERSMVEHYEKMRHRDEVNEQRHVKRINEGDLISEDRVKEAYKKGMLDTKNVEGVENIRSYYLQTIQQINCDVMEHVKSMRENAATQIREAVKRERSDIFRKLKAKKKTMNKVQVSSEERSETNFNPSNNLGSRKTNLDDKTNSRFISKNNVSDSKTTNNLMNNYLRREKSSDVKNLRIQNIKTISLESKSDDDDILHSEQILYKNPEKQSRKKLTDDGTFFNTSNKPLCQEDHSSFDITLFSVNDLPVNLKRNDGEVH